MTAEAVDLDKMELVLNTEQLSASEIQKIQELEKTICADKDFIAAEDVEAACQAIVRHIDQTQEELMAKYEELKASLTEQFKSLMGERELTDEELDAVDGGGVIGWFKRNWKKVLLGASTIVATTAVVVGSAVTMMMLAPATMGLAVAGAGVAAIGGLGNMINMGVALKLAGK